MKTGHSPMCIAKEMVRLGFDPAGTVEDRMEGWTDMLEDEVENLSGLERKGFVAMKQLAKNRRNERRFVDERLRGAEIRTDCPREEDIE